MDGFHHFCVCLLKFKKLKFKFFVISGENLVSKSAQQMETPIGRRTGSRQYGGQHGSRRGRRTSAHRPRSDSLPRERQQQFRRQRLIQHDVGIRIIIFNEFSSSPASNRSQHSDQRQRRSAQLFQQPAADELQRKRRRRRKQQQNSIVSSIISSTTTTTAATTTTTKRE